MRPGASDRACGAADLERGKIVDTRRYTHERPGRLVGHRGTDRSLCRGGCVAYDERQRVCVMAGVHEAHQRLAEVRAVRERIFNDERILLLRRRIVEAGEVHRVTLPVSKGDRQARYRHVFVDGGRYPSGNGVAAWRDPGVEAAERHAAEVHSRDCLHTCRRRRRRHFGVIGVKVHAGCVQPEVEESDAGRRQCTGDILHGVLLTRRQRQGAADRRERAAGGGANGNMGGHRLHG